MRVLLSTYGSRGDVEPMVGLAVALRARGAQVRVCAPPDQEFTRLLAGAGVPVARYPRPWRSWERPTGPEERTRRVAELIDAQYGVLASAAQDCDVLLATAMSHFVAPSVAEQLGIPHHYAAFAPVALDGLDHQSWDELFGPAINAHRASIDLPPVHDVRTFMLTDRPWLAADPTLGPWAGGADLEVVRTGAWLLPDERPLPADVEAFLAAGPPPVYVGFGSMRDVPAGIGSVAIEAIRAQGRRALVGRGWAGLTLVDDRDDCMLVGEVNQQALFGRVAAVVHHGGAGTTTTAARAGAAQVVVPQAGGDQPYWARRVVELGIGAALDGPTPTTESLSAALATALTPPTRERAARLAASVRSDGAVVAAGLLLGGTGRPSAFALPERLSAKADPTLIDGDDRHFAAVADTLELTVADLSDRLDAVRAAPGGTGQEAMDRDLEVHRLTARLRALRRFGLDLCLGRMVLADRTEPVYVGRLGLTDRAGVRLLTDWRSPAAEPFFGATHADPMGLTSRRRYRWTGGRVSDYWDEVFTGDGLEGHAALDDQSAFIASLGSNRSARMRDVLSTIASDQDAIIRAGSRGALVVDGGPGTGKTVVALHRAAYLLYSDPRLGHRRGGVLFVGPHQPYLAYVADVLPSLGEEGVQTCTLRDLVPQGAAAVREGDPRVARLKSSARLVQAVEPAVRLYEEPPTAGLTVSTHWSDVWLSPADWAAAFDAPAPGTPHNEARDEVWDELVSILLDRHEDDVPADQLRRSLRQHGELLAAFNRAWPLLEATDLVGDLWSVPAYLRRCAPWLHPDEVHALQRGEAQAWTVSDLPLLDAARARLGDPEVSRRRRRQEAAVAAQRVRMADVVDDLVAADDSEMLVMSMLRGDDLQSTLVDETAPTTDPDLLAGPFAHIIVDEAQELTDAEWQMLLLRCPSRSFTVVGDRAQARHGFTEFWSQRLARVGLDRIASATLSINYRTPQEVMAEAEPVIRAALPDANVPASIRGSGHPVVHGSVSELGAIVAAWCDGHAEGIGAVIGDPTFPATPRVRSLTPELAKGLEFDLVVLVDPASFGEGIEGAVDRYVAMTRATQQLVVLTSSSASTGATDWPPAPTEEADRA